MNTLNGKEQFEGSLPDAIGSLLKIAVSRRSLEEKLDASLGVILEASPLTFHREGSLFLADGQAGSLVLAASRSTTREARHACASIPFGHCVCGRAAQERRIIYLDHDLDRIAPHGHFCTPIMADEQLLGVLNVLTAPRHPLSEAEERFLSTVTQCLALMIMRHRNDEDLLAQRDLLRAILDHIPYRVFWKDRSSVFRGGNLSFARDAGVASPDDLLGRRDEDLPGRCAEAATFRRRDEWVLAGEGPLRDYEELRHFADGREGMIFGHLLPLHDARGDVSGVLGIYEDVTEKLETENRLRNLTHNDQLTGLPNLFLFKERLDQALALARRLQRRAAVVCFDLDNFKKINNTFGHAVGDEVLRQAGERLSQLVFDNDLVGRMGGDCFLLLFRNLHLEEDIALVLRKLRLAFSQPFAVAGHEVFITASIGIALYPIDGDDADALLKNADIACHQAKQKGRNGYQFYSPAMNASALMRLSLESQMRRAIEQRQFEVYYQPQVAAADGRLVGAEALVRWQHPELGTIAPGDFISLAEESGLIVEIGAWVLNEVCQQARRWHDRGLGLERVAVNLSPRQFQQHDIVTTVCAALLDSGLDPGCLELEITESAVMYDSEQTAEALHYFREMGVRIAIDDFGTGYSSLSQLKKYPITLLKIDRSFVSGIGHGGDDDAIVGAVIAMARKLGLRVLAEGVETAQQWELLRASECDELQGFLFGRPLALVQFEELLEKQRLIS